MHNISIIIPVLNEANSIGDLLRYLTENSTAPNIQEIIVVDGGSTDGTQDIIRALGLNITLLNSAKGRAKQMNIGAKKASGSILYFLHADSFPPNKFDAQILDEVKNGNNAGCFRMQFDSNHWWLKLISWFTKFNWRICRGGDQSLFISQKLFNEIGGYNEDFNIYEDHVLIKELYARNAFRVINKKLTTSARMYKKHGVWKLQYHYIRIYIKKWFGASADDLMVYYKKNVC